jgi:hypothetical protein
MGVRASNLFPHRTFTFSYEGQQVSITYTKEKESPAFLREQRSLAVEDELVRFLAATLVTWDVLDDDNQPWPTDEDGLAVLGFDFLLAVTRAIGEDVVGGKDRTGQPDASANGSSPVVSTEAVPTGTPVSGQPAT